ncbi:MAG: NAD+ synthase [Xanthomonadales bacterium]|nr:NAD+ synthase [Xanthomonadales bacterium]
MRIALAQFDFPVGAVAANAARMLDLVSQARAGGAALIVFPELSLCGYPPEDLLLRESFVDACATALEGMAKQVMGIAVVVGHPSREGALLYNAASVLIEGRIAHTYRKQRLPNYAVFDEKRYFAAGPSGSANAAVFDLHGLRIGLAICEDLWHEAPMHGLVQADAQLCIGLNASPYESNKSAERDAMLLRQAQRFSLPIAYLNSVGGQDALVFDGASMLVDRDGRSHAPARAFADVLLEVDLDAEQGAFHAVTWPQDEDHSRAALNYAALVRGTRDYVRKTGFSRVLLGLSGGIDSALTLAIAVDALGAAHVTAVRLPSRYTSDLSQDLAATQAQTLGVRLLTLPIEAPFGGFLHTLQPLFAGRDSDLTEQNLQSRSRGALLMALSNLEGALLLTTGNKSEYAVGYATIYGDMCGAYAPLIDVYKTEVYALCAWRNRTGEVIPQAVIDRPPSAELKPDQKDQDSLPPYDILDAILYRFIELELSQGEITEQGFDPDTVQRVAQLVFRSEYKRRQAAPGPKITRRAFNRERRYPISSGWR